MGNVNLLVFLKYSTSISHIITQHTTMMITQQLQVVRTASRHSSTQTIGPFRCLSRSRTRIPIVLPITPVADTAVIYHTQTPRRRRDTDLPEGLKRLYTLETSFKGMNSKGTYSEFKPITSDWVKSDRIPPIADRSNRSASKRTRSIKTIKPKK